MGLVVQPFEIHRHSLFVTCRIIHNKKVLFTNHISEGGKDVCPLYWITDPPLFTIGLASKYALMRH